MTRRTTIRRWAWSAMGVAAGAAVLALSAGACSSETAGETISFSAGIAGATESGAAPGQEFVTYAGWRVQVSKALIAAGPIYYYAGQPQARWYEGLLGIRTAHACPTHAQYDKGTVLGEVVQQFAVDLTGAPLRMGTFDGVAGTCQSVELHLHPPGALGASSGGNSLAPLEGYTVILEGTASKDAVTRPFRAKLSLPDEGLMRIVEGIPASVPMQDVADKPGFVLVEVLVDQWLSTVDFETLTDKDGDTYLFTESTQAWTSLIRGIRAKQSYRVAWRSE